MQVVTPKAHVKTKTYDIVEDEYVPKSPEVAKYWETFLKTGKLTEEDGDGDDNKEDDDDDKEDGDDNKEDDDDDKEDGDNDNDNGNARSETTSTSAYSDAWENGSGSESDDPEGFARPTASVLKGGKLYLKEKTLAQQEKEKMRNRKRFDDFRANLVQCDKLYSVRKDFLIAVSDNRKVALELLADPIQELQADGSFGPSYGDDECERVFLFATDLFVKKRGANKICTKQARTRNKMNELSGYEVSFVLI